MKQIIVVLSALGAMSLVGCGPEVQSELELDREVAVRRDALTGPMPYRGINLAGAEFGIASDGTGANPGVHGTAYIYPDEAYASGYTADYFLRKGMTTFRLPFRWERLQRTRNAAFDAAELTRLRTTVNRLTGKGAVVLLDPHNYARYGTALIGSASVPNAHFADFWSRLANEFKGNPNVLFGLMNEPYDMPTEQWVNAANAAIAAIRATGASNLILVPGNAWTGAHSWTQNWYGTANSVAMLNIRDPGNNFAFEVHQYFDSNSSGSSATCASSTAGAAQLGSFTQWLRANGRKGFLGEFAVGNNATCLTALEGVLSYLDANADVYLGWTWWAAGPWWGNAWTSLEPLSGGADKPQMDVLERHLAAAAPAPSCTDGLKNGTETGIDCGGSCAACAPVASCTDGLKNGTETGVDCGGSCAACAPVASCTDGLKNGTETGIDCGGSCAACAPVASCTDGLQNGAETGVDCGGSCAACAPAASCTDGVKNGAETGVDCGGSCAACTTVTTCTPTTWEAELAYRSTGGKTTGGWNLWSNGYLETTSATFPSTASTLVVTARGSLAGGVGPRMTVSVGATTLGVVSVTSLAWAPYAFPVPGGIVGPIRVTFDNDAVVGSEDRNLYVDKLALECGVTSAPPPSSSTCSGATYEAESMSRTTGGATTGGWNLWSNGSLYTSHRFTGGSMRVAITARGSSAGGVWPRMRLFIGGELQGTVSVSSTSWKEYVFEVAPTAGTAEFRVNFDNDAVISGEDRNLYVDKVVVRCP